MPARPRDLPSTLKQSATRAQNTYTKALDSAIATYGAGDRARRNAFAAVRDSFNRKGDHWEPKPTRGSRSAQSRSSSSTQSTRSRNVRPGRAVNVDPNANKDTLMNMARRMDISGRSRMNKPELLSAIRRENRRVRARSSSR